MRWLRGAAARPGTCSPIRGTRGSTASSVRSGRVEGHAARIGKDSALAMYDRDVAMRVAERSAALGGLRRDDDRRCPGAGRAIRSRRVRRRDERARSTLPVLYRNARFVDLRPSMTTSETAARAPISPFAPRRWLRNGHVMTVFAWARRRDVSVAAAHPKRGCSGSAPDTQVLAHCYWQPDRAAAPDAARAPRARRIERGALHARPGGQGLARGWNAVLLNQRNCGGTEHLTPACITRASPPIRARSFATLAGRDGLDAIRRRRLLARRQSRDEARRRARRSPDLPVRRGRRRSARRSISSAACAPSSGAPTSRITSTSCGTCKARMRRKAARWPGAFDLAPLGSHLDDSRFDDVYTAPHHGFGGRERTTTIRRARCASSIGSAFRR